MSIEAERAGVDQKGGPDQIEAGRVSRRLTITIELGRRAGEIGGGSAQAKVVIRDQRRICAPNWMVARASGEFGERCPDPSHRRRASEDIQSLT